MIRIDFKPVFNNQVTLFEMHLLILFLSPLALFYEKKKHQLQISTPYQRVEKISKCCSDRLSKIWFTFYMIDAMIKIDKLYLSVYYFNSETLVHCSSVIFIESDQTYYH